jgi:TPR repeat protein
MMLGKVGVYGNADHASFVLDNLDFKSATDKELKVLKPITRRDGLIGNYARLRDLYSMFENGAQHRMLRDKDEVAADIAAIHLYNDRLMQYIGNDRLKSDKLAFEWAQKGSRNHNMQASELLTRMYLEGIGTKVNHAEAVRVVEQFKESVWKAEMLGYFHEHGIGGYEKSLDRAVAEYRKIHPFFFSGALV